MMDVGDRVRLLVEVYDDADGDHPLGILGLRGDIVIVRRIRHHGLEVAHEQVKDVAFLVYREEVEVIDRKRKDDQ